MRKASSWVTGVLLGLSISMLVGEELFRARSRDAGYKSFDLTATEVKRGDRTSVLRVPGFHSRTGAASRWLMCVYTDLAVQRGFKFWTVVYPQPPSEDLIVGFPRTQDEKVATTLGKEFDSKYLLPTAPVEKLSVLCAQGLVHEQ